MRVVSHAYTASPDDDGAASRRPLNDDGESNSITTASAMFKNYYLPAAVVRLASWPCHLHTLFEGYQRRHAAFGTPPRFSAPAFAALARRRARLRCDRRLSIDISFRFRSHATHYFCAVTHTIRHFSRPFAREAVRAAASGFDFRRHEGRFIFRCAFTPRPCLPPFMACFLSVVSEHHTCVSFVVL